MENKITVLFNFTVRLKQLFLCFCNDVNTFHFCMLTIIYVTKPLKGLIFSHFVKANCSDRVPFLKFLVQAF